MHSDMGAGPKGETQDARIRRLTMRSWRRGMKEMDIILGPFAEARLPGMEDAALARYDRLLAENDQDLLAAVLGQGAPPEGMGDLMADIASFARSRLGTDRPA